MGDVGDVERVVGRVVHAGVDEPGPGARSRRPKGAGMPNEPVILGFQNRGTLALPADLRRRHNLDKPGAQVRVVEREDGVVELHPLAAVPADQAWFWTERWQEMERDADADVAAGRVTNHDTVEELFHAFEA